MAETELFAEILDIEKNLRNFIEIKKEKHSEK